MSHPRAPGQVAAPYHAQPHTASPTACHLSASVFLKSFHGTGMARYIGKLGQEEGVDTNACHAS